jgi:hypothetical protein
LKVIARIKSIILFDTYGAVATASFVICVVSGIFLAIPFDVKNPFESVTVMLIANPAAGFIRNMHYWSAQFFLVFTILHLWDHLKNGTEKDQTSGIWLRLSISVPVVFFVMITGFILKGDADSMQAGRILSTLFGELPFIGESAAFALFGKEEDFQIIYLHHVATASVFLAIIIWEHAKTLWTRISTWMILLATFSLISFIFHAPIHNGLSPVVKGPWYFIGLQEILHWLSDPGLILYIIFLLILIFFLLFFMKAVIGRYFKKLFLIFFYVYSILTFTGYFFRGESWSWELPWEKQYIQENPFRPGFDFQSNVMADLRVSSIPKAGNKREACMICHKEVKGFSPAHDPQAIGCSSCHLGDPFTLNKNRAHRNMVLIPGNLSVARQTCGSAACHPEMIPRINQSLMTTNSGIVSVDRFVFGESGSPDAKASIKEIGHSAADTHLRNLCANCHLGNEKSFTGPVDQESRGGGCTACHLNYTEQSFIQHQTYISSGRMEKLLPEIHPSLSIKITNDHCFGCHSRSGRISANYEGWHETILDESEIKAWDGFRVLQDKRVFEYISEDVHHKAGMDCIDCHNSYETMGDGNTYMHEEQAVKILCSDCHFSKLPETIKYEQLDYESKKIYDLRKPVHAGNPMIAGSASGIALINTYIADNTAYLSGKNTGKVYTMSSPSPVCTKNFVHESLSCSACHSAWAPRCIGCHNEYDRNVEGYDMLKNVPVQGSWVEYVGKFIGEPPTLGMREGDHLQVEPAIPGMIITIDPTGFSKGNAISKESSRRFLRLFAPSFPHTTAAKGRSCKSCHNNPLAIGYGRGELSYTIENNKGKWHFRSFYSSVKYDGLPEDAWIEFNLNGEEAITLSEKVIRSTRNDFRPFTIEEQRKILRIGACLTCHDENSAIILNSLDEKFEDYILRISKECILPAWQ